MRDLDFSTICNVTLVSPELARKNQTVKDFLEKDKDKPYNVVSQLILTGILRTEFKTTNHE